MRLEYMNPLGRHRDLHPSPSLYDASGRILERDINGFKHWRLSIDADAVTRAGAAPLAIEDAQRAGRQARGGRRGRASSSAPEFE
ncbi:MAG: hypothetical protein JZD41_00420, partial [Thermoproteus sp.]|nr:hypothetical protein [Thermoproteus sp.]